SCSGFGTGAGSLCGAGGGLRPNRGSELPHSLRRRRVPESEGHFFRRAPPPFVLEAISSTYDPRDPTFCVGGGQSLAPCVARTSVDGGSVAKPFGGRSDQVLSRAARPSVRWSPGSSLGILPLTMPPLPRIPGSERPPPPAELSAREAEVWRDIVDSRPL